MQLGVVTLDSTKIGFTFLFLSSFTTTFFLSYTYTNREGSRKWIYCIWSWHLGFYIGFESFLNIELCSSTCDTWLYVKKTVLILESNSLWSFYSFFLTRNSLYRSCYFTSPKDTLWWHIYVKNLINSQYEL